MADLDLRDDTSNVYSDIEDDKNIPLFVRYSNRDSEYQDKNSTVRFDEATAKLSGVHTCYFIHRKQKGRNIEYEELAIKFDKLPYCMTAQLAKDGITLRTPHFSEKNMVLPEEKELFVERKCNVRFADLNDNSLNLLKSAGSYWLNHDEEISQFLKDCFSLQVPPIEIQIEEDKEMWQAYLDGLNALLESKRELIKIKKVEKLKSSGLLRLEIDTDSYAQNLRNAILDELSGKCEYEPRVTIAGRECRIVFNSYQIIPEETIDEIKAVGRDYCYKAASAPANTVCGEISIVSDSDKLLKFRQEIDAKLRAFGVDIERDDSWEYHLSSDKELSFLHKIVDSDYNGVAEVVPTTKLFMPLSPAADSVDIDSLVDELPKGCEVKQAGEYFIVSSGRPLKTDDPIFSKLRFASCRVSVSPQQIDSHIQFEGASIKDGAYMWVISKLDGRSLGRLFQDVVNKYPKQFVRSSYSYAFMPQIDKAVLQTLKMKNYGNASLQVDVPRSCVVFRPKTLADYESLRAGIMPQIDETISAKAPEYKPTAKVEFLCENEDYRRGVFEKVNEVLANKRGNFTKNTLREGARTLEFAFNFANVEERDSIETSISSALSLIQGIEIVYDNNNSKGRTEWVLEEDPSLLQEAIQKLQTDFKNESVNIVNGSGYDRIGEGDGYDDEMNDNQYSKEKLIRREQRQFLQNPKNCLRVGICAGRSVDHVTIKLNEETLDQLSSKELRISEGDYIQFPATGEAVELSRQRTAMNRILRPESRFNSRPANPNLPNFIFDPKYADETFADIEAAKEDIRSHKIGNLNEKQLEAVTKSVLSQDLALIQGPPGTGKTTVIAEIIWQEIRRNPDCRILLTSQTNLAVDNALERLQGCAGIRPVRIGKPDKMEPEGRRFSLPVMSGWAQDDKENEDNAVRMWMDRIAEKASNDAKYSEAVASWRAEMQEKDKHSRLEFCNLYKSNANLVAATCSICGSHDFSTSYSDMFGETKEIKDMFFDVVIMDEASKATPLEMAVPLVLGKKIIVIGDHKQLPPMLDEDTIDSSLEKIGRKDLADKLRKTESQFKRLFESAAKVRKTIVSTLDTQYRMHEQIMNTIKQFYEEELSATGGLKCGITDTMDIPDLHNKGSRWHGITMDPIIRPDTHAVWIDVHTPEKALKPGYMNEGELRSIDLVLEALQQADGYSKFVDAQQKPEDKEIGIITFYSAQKREIKKRHTEGNYRIDVVDRFQGMERNIVIVSTVRSNKNNNIGFAKEIERINVAFSRARRLLIVVGNKRQFESNSNYAASISNMETVDFEQLKAAVR